MKNIRTPTVVGLIKANNELPAISSADAGKLATVDSNGKWAAANLTVGQGEVAVDSTLLVTGAAADAKVTGDKVAELKSAIDSIETDQVLPVYSADISGTTSATINMAIPAGQYDVYCDSMTSSDTDADYSYIVFYNGSTKLTTLLFGRTNTQQHKTLTLTAAATVFYAYAATTYLNSQGDTFAYDGFRIVKNTNLNIRITTNEQNIESAQAQIDNLTAIDNPVYLVKSGNQIFIRSAWDADNDIATGCGLAVSQNGLFNMTGLYLVDKDVPYTTIDTSLLYQTLIDDICPSYFDGTYIGGNHGFSGAHVLTSQNHGLTESDIGKTITFANGSNRIITRIINANEFMTLGLLVSGAINSTTPVSPATFNGREISFTAQITQLKPALNHHSIQLYADNVLISGENAFNKCRTVKIIEKYDIIDIGAMYDYLVDNAGYCTNESMCSDAITGAYCTRYDTYEFQPRGVCLISNAVQFHESVSLGYIGGTQCGTFGTAQHNDYFFVPQSSYYALSQQVADVSTSITPSTWADADIPPFAYYQFADNTLAKGVVVGFVPGIGNAKDEIRKNVTTACVYNKDSHKIYPHLADDGNMNAVDGSIASSIAFRVPLKKLDNDLTAICWFTVNKSIYLMIAAHSNVKKAVDLPITIAGKTLEVIASDGDITVNEAISGNTILVSVNNYGWATVKID